MSTPQDDASSLATARESRRWLIGVCISLAFGLFGVVMALLGYVHRTSSAAPAGVNMPAKHAPEPAAPRQKRRQEERRK